MEQKANRELQRVMDPAELLFSRYQRRTQWTYSENEEASLRKRVEECTADSEKRVQYSDILLAFIIYIYKIKQAHSHHMAWTETEDKKQIYRKIYILAKEDDDDDDRDNKQIEFLQEIEKAELERAFVKKTKMKLEEYISAIPSRKKSGNLFSHWTFVICGHTFYWGDCSEIKKTAALCVLESLEEKQSETHAPVEKYHVSLEHFHALQQGQLGRIVNGLSQDKRMYFLKTVSIHLALTLIEAYMEKRTKDPDISGKFSFLYGTYTLFGYTMYSCHPKAIKIHAAENLKKYLEAYTLPTDSEQDVKHAQKEWVNALQYGRLGGIFKHVPESTRREFLDANKN